MSVNEEFLDEVLGKMLGGGYPWANGKGKGFKYSDSEGFDITEDVEEAKQAILQHFQQEQESLMVKGAEAFRDQLSIAFMFRSEKVMETIDEELQGYKHFLRGGKGGK